MMQETDELIEAFASLQEDEVKILVKGRIVAGVAAVEIVDSLQRGMIEVGKRFEQGEYFIPALIHAGNIMKDVMVDLAPLLEKEGANEPVGRVVMGTVYGDVHDIGREIVTMMLRNVGLEVIDLGHSVPPEKFIAAIRKDSPQVVGMSVLLTTCYMSVVNAVQAVRDAGLRDKVKIMVGGGAASPLLCERAGCDFYGKEAVDGVRYAREVAGVT